MTTTPNTIVTVPAASAMSAEERAREIARRMAVSIIPSSGSAFLSRAAQSSRRVGAGAISAAASAAADHFSDVVEINDYPRKARQKIMQRETLDQIVELTEAAITSRGEWIQPGRKPPEGVTKLHLLLEGRTQIVVKKAKQEILRRLNEVTMEVGFEKSEIYAKYSII